MARSSALPDVQFCVLSVAEKTFGLAALNFHNHLADFLLAQQHTLLACLMIRATMLSKA